MTGGFLTAPGTAPAVPKRRKEPRSRTPARRLLGFGPAFIAAVAYVDPGNFATNFTAGSRFGYQLLWVVVAANLIAVLVQMLAAKLGLATGRDLATLCRERYPRPVVLGLWLTAELVAMATDLAEVVGGVIALNLLFDVPPPVGAAITAGISFLLLALETRGVRRFTLAVVGILGVVVAGFVFDALKSGVSMRGVTTGLVPTVSGADGLTMATAILGATVMPHVVYLHSTLTSVPSYRDPHHRDPRALLSRMRLDVTSALGAAGLVNAAMMVIAAQVLMSPHAPAGTMADIHQALGRQLGRTAAASFGLALLASGFASSAVGTLSGQAVMAGFLGRSGSVFLRRGITLAPALIVILLGLNTTTTLIWSQVILSLGLPFALVPLITMTGNRKLMGPLVNALPTTVGAVVVTLLVSVLNLSMLTRLAVGK